MRILVFLMLGTMALGCRPKCKTVGTTRCSKNMVQVCSGEKEWTDVMDCTQKGTVVGKPMYCKKSDTYNVHVCGVEKTK